MAEPANLRAAFVSVIGAVVLALTGCGAAADDGGLLTEDDLSDVVSVTELDRGTGPVGTCGRFNALESILGRDPIHRRFELGSGDQVTSSRISADERNPDAASIVADLSDAIDECLARTDDADEVTRLDFGAGTAGYRSVSETSNGSVTVDRGYAVVDDARVVIVAVRRQGSGEPTESVARLMPLAVERAADS